MFLRITSKKTPVFEPSSIYFNYTDFFPLKLQNSVIPNYHTGNREFRVSLWVIREGKKSSFVHCFVLHYKDGSRVHFGNQVRMKCII